MQAFARMHVCAVSDDAQFVLRCQPRDVNPRVGEGSRVDICSIERDGSDPWRDQVDERFCAGFG